MPIEFTPPRSLIDAYLRLRARARGEKPQANTVKTETITAVTGDGMYTVKGKSIPVTGNAVLNAGEAVDVAWKNGRPVVILAHNARRAQFHPVSVQAAQGVVEEIFRLTRPDGKMDVYFRNDSVFTTIVKEIPAAFIAAGSSDGIHWGTGSSSFFCVDALRGQNGKARVYRVNRPRPNEPFAGGTIPVATLVREYDFGPENSGFGPSFGIISLTLKAGGNPATVAAGPFQYRTRYTQSGINGTGEIVSSLAYAGLSDTGELIVKVNVSGVTQAPGGANYFLGQIFVNVDTGAVLANHVANFLNVPNDGVNRSITAECTTGVLPTLAGELALMSVKRLPPSNVFDVNNYLLLSPGFITTVAAIPSRLLAVKGEFGQNIFLFGSARQPFVTYSRTRVIWADTDQFSFTPVPVKLTILRTGILKTIGSNHLLEFPTSFSDPFDGHAVKRAVVVDHGDLTYAPNDVVAPYNRTFFPANAKLGNFDIAAMEPDSRLRPFAKLKEAEVGSEGENVLFFAGGSDLQILNSPQLLGPVGMFQGGPL